MILDLGGATLPRCLKEHHGASDRDIQGRNSARHGDAQQVVARLAHQLVQPCALAAEHQRAGGSEVELVIVGGPALIEADHPDAGLFDLFERPGHVHDAGHGHMLGGPGGRLGSHGAQGSGPAFGADDAVDACAIGRADQRTKVLGVLHAIEREQQRLVAAELRLEEVLEVQQLLGAHHGHNTLVGGCFRELGEVVPRFHAKPDASFAAQGRQLVELGVCAVAGQAYMIKGARSGANSLFHRMQSIQNIHPLQCIGASRYPGWGRELFASMQPPGTLFGRHASFGSSRASEYADMSSVAKTIAAGSNAGSMASAEIATRLKQKDPLLLDQLIVEYQHRLLRYLLYLTGNRELAEDLFQETWMRVLLRGAQFNGNSRFDTWLFTIARNLVIDFRRRRTMASLEEMSEKAEDDRPFEVVSTDPTPFDKYLSRQNSALVAEALLTLEPLHREVLVLRFHEELALEQIATVTGAPLSTVKSRLYRGLAALRPFIQQAISRPAEEARA